MVMGKKIIPEVSLKSNTSIHARNLAKKELGAIIFGCKHSTMKECLDRELFGLPASHYPYVRKASPGLPLFLFNYSDRKLHGVFEAVSLGQMNISPYAWISEGCETTPYPAQVRIRTRSRCRPLLEEEIKPILAENYYTDRFLWFELDKEQTESLMGLFMSSPLPNDMPLLSNVAWKRTPPSSDIRKTADEEFKYADWQESPGIAEARLQFEHSNASTIYSPAKKWCDLFKPSSSSAVVDNGDVLEPQKVSSSWSGLFKPSASSSVVNNGSELPPEANAECDSVVPECWEDIFDDGESGTPNLPDMPISESTAIMDGWGELNMQAEELVESLIDNDTNNRSDIALAPVEDCEGARIQLNETHRAFQQNEYVLSERVVTDVLIKLMGDIEVLRVSQLNQGQKIEILQQELAHSRQETNELKRRCQQLECLANN